MAFEQYEDSGFARNCDPFEQEETFKKIPKSPKNLDGYNPKGKKKNKKDYSKERSKKRDYE